MRSRSVRFWMDATFVKDGSSAESATPWHNDECTFPFRGEMMPSFWVALTDVTMDNAPIVTLRGSNRDPWRYHSPMSNPEAFEVEHIPWSHLERRVTRTDAPKDIWPSADSSKSVGIGVSPRKICIIKKCWLSDGVAMTHGEGSTRKRPMKAKGRVGRLMAKLR
ncbi:MAG: hypothetical protein EBT81_02315 [Gammaproteobacteria bacterium]|nr:hypothetical protein [Gammaproteobacteria bacterium]